MKRLENPPPLEPTRKELREKARDLKIRGYSKLNKTELLQRLRALGDQILDRDIDVRMVNVPFLTPTTYIPP